MKKWIPNALTLSNLFCGCAALISLQHYAFLTTCWLLLAAGLCDLLDGLVARWLGVSSEHGKELDSLADMVSFGLVPGMIYYVLLFRSFHASAADISAVGNAPALVLGWSWLAAPGLLLVLFSALRLAKFNLDTRQTENFIGVATPTSTLFAVGLLLIHSQDTFGWGLLMIEPGLLYPVVAVFCYLLVSEHPMFSFKIKGRQWAGNQTRIIFALLAIALLFGLRTAAFPFIVGAYLIINLLAPPKTSAP